MLRRIIVALISLSVLFTVPAIALAGNASAATCQTTHTYTHTTTSKGTDTQRWTTRYACGKEYKKWETIKERSYTGSRYVESVYRYEMRYPHYTQRTVKSTWTAKNVYSHTVTVKTG